MGAEIHDWCQSEIGIGCVVVGGGGTRSDVFERIMVNVYK